MGFVGMLTVDDDDTSDPTWEDVERAINSLDDRTRTLVILAPRPRIGDCHMAIGGGGDGRFIVYLTNDNLSFFNLVDPDTANDERAVQMMIGGQVGEYCRSQFASLEQAIQAAHQYFEDGTRAPGLTWLEQ